MFKRGAPQLDVDMPDDRTRHASPLAASLIRTWCFLFLVDALTLEPHLVPDGSMWNVPIVVAGVCERC